MSKNLSHILLKQKQKTLFEKIGQNPNLTENEIEKLAKEYKVSRGVVAGTKSFYDCTNSKSSQKKARICNGSSCITADDYHTIRSKVNNLFSETDIGEVCCLGRCYENGAVEINGMNYSGTEVLISEQNIEKLQSKKDEYPVAALNKKILTGSPLSDKDFELLIKRLLTFERENLIQEIKISGLRGRGGAGFPAGMKIESCAKVKNEEKFVVCNGDEGDPGAYSDRYLMENQSLLLLGGMLIAGYCTGAEQGIIYVRNEYPDSVKTLQRSIEYLEKSNLIGHNILNTKLNFYVKVIVGQGAYICGEETALLNSIEGQRPEVRVRPPYPTQQGLFNKPTLVNNVETLANLYYILNHGGKSYSEIGKPQCTGTKLMSFDSKFMRPGLYEADMGTPLDEIIEKLAGGYRTPVKALHIGGPLGGIVPIEQVKELTIDFESFSKAGFLLGHASVVGIPVNYPMKNYLLHLFTFTAAESCGKCFPCRLGSIRGKEMLAKAIDRTTRLNQKLLLDLLKTMEIGSLCALGGGLPLPVRNILEYFTDEIEELFDV